MGAEVIVLILLVVRLNACSGLPSGYEDCRESETKIANVLRVMAALKRDRLDVVVHPADDDDVLRGVLKAMWRDERRSVTLHDAPGHCHVLTEGSLARNQRLQARSQVIVVRSGSEVADVVPVFATLQRRGIYDVVVVVGERLLTWRPFSDPLACGRPDASNVVPWRESDADSTLTDFRGCEITVTTLVWPPYVTLNYSDGLEIRMIRTLAAASNLSLRFREPSSSSWFASYQDVSSGRTDMAMGSLMGIAKLFAHCEATIFYLTESVMWAVPSPARLPRWRSLSLAFEKEVWAAVTAILVCAVAALRVLGERDVSRAALLTAWPTMLGTSAHLSAPAVGVGLRLCFAAWALYCLLVDTAFTSVLVGILVDPGREPRFTDESQLVASDLEIGYSEGMQTVLGEALRGRGGYCDDYEACLDRVALRGDFAFVVLRRYVSYVSKKRYEATGETLFYTLDGNIMTSGVTSYFRKGHPALPRVNALLWRLLNAGLFAAWEADLSRQVTLSVNVTERNSLNVTLTLDHFQSAFQLLALGCFLSAVAFASEIFIHKRRLRKLDAQLKISY